MNYDFTELDFTEEIETTEVNIEPGKEEITNNPNPLNTEEVKEEEGQLDPNNTDASNADTPDLDDSEPTNPTNDNQSTLSIFAQSLKEGGVFAGIEDDKIAGVKSVEDLLKLMDESLTAKKYANLTQSQQRYLESLETGIPKSEFDKLEKELNNIEAITPEALENNPQLQFNVIALGLMEQGIEKEKATKIANSLMASGSGLAESLDSRNQLYKIKEQKFKEGLEAKKQDTKLSVEKTKEMVDGKESVLSSVPLSASDKETIFRSMTSKVDINENGEPINRFTQWRKEKGVEAEFVINALFTLTNEFKDLGRLGEVAKTQAAKKLEERLKQNESNDYINQNSGFQMKNDSNPYNLNV